MDFIISKKLTNTQLNYLHDKFYSLFEAIPYPQSEQLQKFFFKKYQEPHRAYHNLPHIYNLLQLSDEYFSDENKAFELAIWYHDVIYDSAKKDNEIQSADLFLKHFKEEFLFDNFLTEENILWTNYTILSTAGHQPQQDSDNEKLFLDMDLSILAADENTYFDYAKAIREEYNIYSDELYDEGRIKVLKHFLDRKEIYFTEVFKSLEPIARQNIKNEIQLLQSKNS